MRSLTRFMVLTVATTLACDTKDEVSFAWGDDTGVPEADADVDADADGDYDWPEGSELEPVYNAVFSTCKGCHKAVNPSGGISLTEENIRDELLLEWVVAGDTENSLLLEKLDPAWGGDGGPMPKPDGSPPENIALVAEWIEAGANP